MNKKRLLAMLLGVVLIFALVACGGGDTASTPSPAPPAGETTNETAETPDAPTEVIRITFGHDDLPGAPLTEGAEYWAELLYEVSGGTMVLDVFDSSALGNKTELLDRLFAGDAMMVVGEGGIAADFGVNDIGITMGPFLFETWEQVDRLVASDLWEELRQEMADSGMTIVGDNWQFGARSTMSARRVETVEDFQGLNIRVPGNTVQVEGMAALGAAPVGMPLAEVYTSLQTGVIEAVENPLSVLIANSFYEVTDYLILTRHVYQIHFIVIGTEFFNNLTEQQQTWLLETGTEAGIFQNQRMMEAEAEAIGVLEGLGMEIIEIDYPSFAEAANSFYFDSSTANSWTPGLYERVREIIG